MLSSYINYSQLSIDLRQWYLKNHRLLPWRAEPGQCVDPYKVWLSEIMLQQTTVATVKSYFLKFIEIWPSLDDLADSSQEEVLAQWAGLGYYSRARNLHKCAQIIQNDYGGKFPETEAALLKLPGIGAYTAAAITAIAFQKRAVVVDGNIERIVARLFNIETPLPQAKVDIKLATANITPDKYSGDFAQGMMDIGASICTPKAPKCLLCPISSYCMAKKIGKAETLPKKEPKKVKPVRRAYFYWIENKEGEVWFIKRPEKGLLGGMPALPSTNWDSAKENGKKFEEAKAELHQDIAIKGIEAKGQITHVFTHFKMEAKLICIKKEELNDFPNEGYWVSEKDVDGLGLPTLLQKVISLK